MILGACTSCFLYGEFPAPTKQQSLNCWIELTYLSPQESEERGQNADDEDDAVRRIRQIDRQLGDLKEMCVREGIHFRFAENVAPQSDYFPLHL